VLAFSADFKSYSSADFESQLKGVYPNVQDVPHVSSLDSVLCAIGYDPISGLHLCAASIAANAVTNPNSK
jgi:hypothetical protein